MTPSHDKVQRELDAITLKTLIMKDSDSRYALKITERIVFGILMLFGIAIVMKLAVTVGLPPPSL